MRIPNGSDPILGLASQFRKISGPSKEKHRPCAILPDKPIDLWPKIQHSDTYIYVSAHTHTDTWASISAALDPKTAK